MILFYKENMSFTFRFFVNKRAGFFLQLMEIRRLLKPSAFVHTTLGIVAILVSSLVFYNLCLAFVVLILSRNGRGLEFHGGTE